MVNIFCFRIIDIYFMNFATIILFLPTTFTHPHDPRPLPTTHDPRHLATLILQKVHLFHDSSQEDVDGLTLPGEQSTQRRLVPIRSARDSQMTVT